MGLQLKINDKFSKSLIIKMRYGVTINTHSIDFIIKVKIVLLLRVIDKFGKSLIIKIRYDME